MPSKQSPKPSWSRLPKPTIVVGVVVLAVLFGSGGLIAYAAGQGDRILSGVHVGGIDLSGRTATEASAVLQAAVDDRLDAGLTFETNGKSVVVESTAATTTGLDTAYPLFTYDVATTVAWAMAVGRETNVLARVPSVAGTLLAGRALPTAVDLDAMRLRDLLVSDFGKLASPAVEAHFALSGNDAATVVPERSGQDFPYDRLVALAQRRLESLSTEAITFSLEPDEPTVRQAQAASLLPQVNAMLVAAPLTLTASDKSWELSDEALVGSLTVGIAGRTSALQLDPTALAPLLDDIATAVDRPAKDAKFAIRGGRVTEFQAAGDGAQLDRAATIAAIEAALDAKTSTAAVVVKTLTANVTSSDGENLGIKELVAVGKTNFAGSPTNRRKNIANGARLLNGLLIKPGETFSLLEPLKPFELSNGYLPELVIKGDRTIPEIGGGLCQIGTTMFRLALNAGVPIVERKNHSYRVRYYEPPVGMDATIYDPKPDFRFTNDYASHLLLQTRIEGDNLIFEFYGTKDGRVAATTAPRTFNVVAPGPKKIIETTDLKPGETKCIEKAHPGSDAEFTYTVTMANGEKRSQVFKSHYVPWREVCLVGVDPKKAKPATEEDTTPPDSGAIGAPTNTNTNSSPTTNSNTSTNTNSAPTNTNSTE